MATRIAVINNDPAFLEMVGDLLEEHGYQVECLRAVPTTLARLRRFAPTVIVLDMPLEEAEASWQLLARCLLDPYLAQTSLILYSTVVASHMHSTTTLPEGRCAIIPKPFGRAAFLALVRQAAERASRGSAEIRSTHPPTHR